MSLTNDIVKELYTLGQNKTCCSKAFLCGLLYGARQNASAHGYTASFYRESDAHLADSIISSRFASGEKAVIGNSNRGGHKTYTVSFYSKALCSFLFDIDSGRADSLEKAVGFRCPECTSQFLRGIFISSATVSTPKSGYNLEFSVFGEKRAEYLQELLSITVGKAGIVRRGGRMGLYYKSSTSISDILYFLGAHSACFEMQNFFIERDIRNTENRATNCVTHNISRSVSSNKRCIDAINKIKRLHAMGKLSEELAYTAELRLEYDSASLSELAERHEPPLSKSGLNQRLKKLLSIADSLDTE